MQEPNCKLPEQILMDTMKSVNDLAIQVAEINATLKTSILNNLQDIKNDNERQQIEIERLKEEMIILTESKDSIKKAIQCIFTIITGIAIPVIAIVLGFL